MGLLSDSDLVTSQLLHLLDGAGLRRLLTSRGASGILQLAGDDENELEDIRDVLGSRRRRKVRTSENRFPAVPSEEGKKLMDGGVFGSSDSDKQNRIQRKNRLARKLMSREQGTNRSHSTRGNSALSQV